MDSYTAIEQAYKNGYERGYKDAAEKIFRQLKDITKRTYGLIFADVLDANAELYGVKLDDGK